jgi:transcriptional regulator with XRE-family HTH domain
MPSLPELRRLRTEQGLTQRALAERAGVTQRTIINLEHGDQARFETIFKLAAALGVEPVVLTIRSQ